MNTAHVLVLCGLPGSGKSTLAGALKETKDFDRIVHIEYDAVAREIQGQCSLATAAEMEVFNDESL
jgi:adenylate kinase family enzyme